jgi:hypothetical protein
MSYDFYYVVRRGLIIADVIGAIGIGVFLYYCGGIPMSDSLAKTQFKLISVLYIVLTVGTFYAHMVYKTKRRIAELRNLDRVHPMPNGRRRWNA